MATTGLCPFSWIETTKKAGCLGSIFGSGDKTVSEPQPCLGAACKLWDAAHADCGLITRKP